MINNSIRYPMIKWAKDIFPLCRSLTGKDTFKTLLYFQNINPEWKFIKFKSGQKVFDWSIPDEWNIEDSFIEHESGKKFASFKKNNLHIMGYSCPVNKKISKTKLLENIYTIKKQPNLIPYLTTYYQKNWGFCMSENQKKKLPAGNYRAYINSTLKKGVMNIGEIIIKGKSKKEIFFSSYICHPSMANNELSGSVLLNALVKYIKQLKKTNYTYRFVLVPETIGSIAYISKNLKNLKKNIKAGFNLSCVGDERSYSLISSRNSNSLADAALESALSSKKNFKKYSYLDRGSDERQYCAPGVNLPVVGFCRSKYGEYPEYHTSADDFKLVTSKGLQDSFEVLKNIIDAFELGIKPKYTVLCEPFMQSKNIYPFFSKKEEHKTTKLRRRTLDILSYADGINNIFEISKIINMPLKSLIEEIEILKKNKLLHTVL